MPPLATIDPNWLLTKAPDVYLFGTILELLNALEGDAAGKYAGLYGQAVRGADWLGDVLARRGADHARSYADPIGDRCVLLAIFLRTPQTSI